MSRKILILTPFHFPNKGGAESFVDVLEKEASKWFNITVLTFQPFKQRVQSYEESYSNRGSLKVYRMNWWIKQSSAWRGVSLRNMLSVIPQMVFSSLLLCLRNKYEIIHAQGLLSGFVAVLLKKVFKVKVFITLLALYEFDKWTGIRKRVVKWVFDNTDLIFVEGDNGRSDISGIVGNTNVRSFNHWVDQSIFCPPKHRDNDRIRVLFVGRPIPEKGRHIVEGAERLLNNKDYEFIYVEDVPYKDLPKYYQMAHIVVVPSLYAEGFTRVVAEAASCGCAVITSDRGSLPEQVGGWGYSCHPSPDNFAKLIKIFSKEILQHSQLSVMHAHLNSTSKNAEVFLSAYSEN